MIGRRDVLKLAGALMGMGLLRPNISEAFISHTQDAVIGRHHVFLGKYYAEIIGGNRLSIPSSLIKGCSDALYVTNAVVDKCLHIFPEAEWQKMCDKVNKLPESNEAVRLFTRRVIISAQKTSLSKDGDIWIDHALLNDAEISDDVVLVGQIDKIELWSQHIWDDVIDIANFDAAKVERELADFSL